jgi:hypothetical protein
MGAAAIFALVLSADAGHAALFAETETAVPDGPVDVLIEEHFWRVSLDAIDAYNRGDYKGAYIRWLEMADHGDAYAQKNLGLLFYYGHGVAQDFAQAADWYKRAAERGHPSAQNNLSIMYALGQGVERDFVEALKWAGLAAGQGFDKSLKLIEFLTANMPAEDIRAARLRIQQWAPVRQH